MELTPVLGLAILTCGFGFGVVIGLVTHYIMEYRPLRDQYDKTTRKHFDMLYRMKKQGFVPQFELEQEPVNDPSDGVVEF